MSVSGENQGDPNSTRMSLLLRAQSGDQTAWNDIVDIYGPMIESRCRNWGFNADDSAELTQEIFVSIHTSLPTFRKDKPDHGFRRWMWTIASRRRADFLRRKSKLPDGQGGSSMQLRLQQLPDKIEEDNAWNPEKWKVEALNRALGLLTTDFEEQRQRAFWMTAVEGRATAEVARELGVKESTIRQSKYHVSKRLREELGDILDMLESSC